MERLAGKVQVGAHALVGAGKRNGPDRRPNKAALEPFEKLLLALADVAQSDLADAMDHLNQAAAGLTGARIKLRSAILIRTQVVGRNLA